MLEIIQNSLIINKTIFLAVDSNSGNSDRKYLTSTNYNALLF